MRLNLFAFLRPLPLLAVAVALAVPGPASARPAASAKASVATKATPPAGTAEPGSRMPAVPRPAIWLLADADTKIYLFGTVHILPPGFRWRSPAVDRVIAEADELVVETYEAPGRSDYADAHKALILDQPVPILGRVPENRRKALKAAIQASSIPIKYYDRLQTWAAGMMLGMAQLLGSYGIDDPTDAPGVEDVLEELFRAAGKPIGSVEHPGEVVAALNAIPAEEQVALLVEGLVPPESAGSQAANEDELWARGEVDAMAEQVFEEFPPALFEALLRKRNQAWTGWLAKRLDRPGTVLFAVGAGHLGGRDSVREMLAARGLKVIRVN